MRPYLTILNGAGLPSGFAAATKPILGKAAVSWKNPGEVYKAVDYVLAWCMKKSKLRGAIQTLQLGGLFYSAHVDFLCTRAYAECGAGKSIEKMKEDAKARLCQGAERSAKASGPIGEEDAIDDD